MRTRLFLHVLRGLLGVAVSVSSAASQSFQEDFNGTVLDPTRWSVQGGQVVVANGFVTLSQSGCSFPVITSIHDPFPPDDFRLRVGLQYLSAPQCGSGFGAMDNFWESYAGGDACRSFLLWQDYYGMSAWSGSTANAGTKLSNGQDLGYHVYEWLYVGGQYQFSMDGIMRATGACAPRATSIFFGHPHPISCCAPWGSLSIDFIEIAPAGVTEVKSSSMGAVKARYR